MSGLVAQHTVRPEEAFTKAFKEAFTEKLIPVTVDSDDLIKEYKDVTVGDEKHPLIIAFNGLTPDTQKELLQLVARVKYHGESHGEHQRGGAGKSNQSDDAQILEVHNDKKTYLDYDILKWFLVLFFGLYLMYIAKENAATIGKEYGLDESYVYTLITNPGKGAGDTIATVMSSLVGKIRDEALFQAKNACGDPNALVDSTITGTVSNALSGVVTFFAGPDTQIKCINDVAGAATKYSIELAQIKVGTTIGQSANLIRSAYVFIVPASVNIARYVVNGTKQRLYIDWKKDTKIKGGTLRRNIRTKRRNTKRRNTKRRNTKRRNTKRSRTKRRNTKRRNTKRRNTKR